jgi:hypothetical protein
LFSVAETAAGMLTGIAEPIATEEDVIRNSRRVGFSELDMSGPWDLPKLGLQCFERARLQAAP